MCLLFRALSFWECLRVAILQCKVELRTAYTYPSHLPQCPKS